MHERLYTAKIEVQKSASEKFVEEALLFSGNKSIRYKGEDRGVTPEEGFDCSGFVTYLLNKIEFPKAENVRHANEYFDNFGVLIHTGLQKRGDLVFFSRHGRWPTHVGIMTSERQYIHAPGKDGTIVSEEELLYEPIAAAEHVIYNQNPIGFKRLAQSNGRWQTFA